VVAVWDSDVKFGFMSFMMRRNDLIELEPVNDGYVDTLAFTQNAQPRGIC
jgi:hypothetical protein